MYISSGNKAPIKARLTTDHLPFQKKKKRLFLFNVDNFFLFSHLFIKHPQKLWNGFEAPTFHIENVHIFATCFRGRLLFGLAQWCIIVNNNCLPLCA